MRANASPGWVQPVTLVAIAGLTLALGGCFGRSSDDVTGSIATGAPAASSASDAAASADKYKADPGNKSAAIGYAKALRTNGQYDQAVAVLQQVAIKQPYDREVLGAYGKALADAGRLKEAADVLSRAHTPDNPNWSVLSAQGSVADQLGEPGPVLCARQAARKG
jgi:Flp pilus assembly protein TadD